MREIEWWIVKVHDKPFPDGGRIEPWESCEGKTRAVQKLRASYSVADGFRVAKVTTETLPVRKKRSKR